MGLSFTVTSWKEPKFFTQVIRGPFLESPGNLPGPTSIFLNVFYCHSALKHINGSHFSHARKTCS